MLWKSPTCSKNVQLLQRKTEFFKGILFHLNELRERKATGSVNIYHQVSQDT